MERIRIENLTKYYGQTLVLHSVNLSVQNHEVVCLIGASGSGKSTLLRCINRLVDFDYGRIYLDGIPITDPRFGNNQLQKRIGIVFQSYNLFPHLSVLENITLAPRKVHGVSKIESWELAMSLLDRFGMKTFAHSYPEQLSGGQQQRVAIVRALATQPDVLLLDEVTAALDPELMGDVLEVIRELKTKGMTMIIVTHEMGFARDVADRVCFLAEGRILEENTPQKVFSQPVHPRTQQFLQRIIAAGRL
ncbi:amino acid ABC transporter ATP-binding protein [Synechococcus sp. Nb3U1]|uniref:amino acid ABC transporter ATP-binding protein n=1 Tax=Synechococcus sp. Nb3U1 TaxID=1914529 RepID=UPI001F39C7A1|nr:amino acid ABC transporter ATP-binding protein [Synechococcus sp. Nb3U1]MCF2971491.1 amino acid ABC transporter ATP-binding protein [Synechococcus sp. Nb3U1]